MRNLFRLLVGVCVSLPLLCSCGDDYSVEIYGNISGMVTDASTGNPLSAAQVTLVPTSKTAQTSADGTFVFNGLEEGQYTISVQKTGYQANRKNVNVVSGETAETVVALTVIPKN